VVAVAKAAKGSQKSPSHLLAWPVVRAVCNQLDIWGLALARWSSHLPPHSLDHLFHASPAVKACSTAARSFPVPILISNYALSPSLPLHHTPAPRRCRCGTRRQLFGLHLRRRTSRPRRHRRRAASPWLPPSPGCASCQVRYTRRRPRLHLHPLPCGRLRAHPALHRPRHLSPRSRCHASRHELLLTFAVGGNAVSAFLSWRLQATNACDVTLVWKSGFDSVHQYGISFKYVLTKVARNDD
jgi:hypothetical protein